MSLFEGLFGKPGYTIGDARAMSADEILNYQLQHICGMQQAVYPDHYCNLVSNYRAPDPRTLDERFADFKLRLAAAIARRAV